MAQIKPCETIELIIVSPFDNSSLIVSQIWRRTYRKLLSIPFSCFIKKPKGCAFWFLIVRFFKGLKEHLNLLFSFEQDQSLLQLHQACQGS